MVVRDRFNEALGRGIAVRTLVLLGMTGLMLAACAPQRVPDSGAGVGFSDYNQYEIDRARREAALRGGPAGGPDLLGPVGGPISAGAPIGQPVPPGGIAASELAAAGIGGRAPAAPLGAPLGAPLNQTGLGGTVVDPLRTAGVQASPSNVVPGGLSSLGISDEQNFDAVASRESIESDAQRRAAQAASYQQVQPTALPQRAGDTGPNIVAYALNAPNRRGQAWYSRLAISSQTRFQNNCASYRSPDEAQRDFLARGGPDRDPRGIDPDGDGFACGWDPEPFRLAVGN